MTITNDGATILKQMQVMHPVAKMVNKCLFTVKNDEADIALGEIQL